MNNILVRSLSGAVFISLVLIPLFFENPVYASIVLSVFALLGIIEYNKLFLSSSIISVDWKLNTFFSLIIYGFIVVGIHGYFGIVFYPLLVIIFPLLFLWSIIELWRKKEQPLINIAISIFGFIYVCVPFIVAISIHIFSISMRTEEGNTFPLLVGMFVLIWTNDTFAFLSGKFFGKTKLFERISPKKTWEGTIGGSIFTIAMAIALSLLFDVNHLKFWIISAIIIIPCSILGDLLESLFKRSLNIKDSGNIMPGHGGILDRFDAALFALPFFFMWLVIYTYFC